MRTLANQVANTCLPLMPEGIELLIAIAGQIAKFKYKNYAALCNTKPGGIYAPSGILITGAALDFRKQECGRTGRKNQVS